MRGSTGSYIDSRVGALTFLTETGIRFPGNLTIIRCVFLRRKKGKGSKFIGSGSAPSGWHYYPPKNAEIFVGF
jgi:hypothetical protein